MAFYNRMLIAIAAIGSATFYAPMDLHKWIAFSVAIGLIVILSIWVSIFSWKKPDHLLYGAETHFEQWKTMYALGSGGAGSTPQAGETVIK